MPRPADFKEVKSLSTAPVINAYLQAQLPVIGDSNSELEDEPDF